MLQDPAVIKYRLDIIDDLLHITVERLGELNLFAKCVCRLKDILTEKHIEFRSEGLNKHYNMVIKITEIAFDGRRKIE